MAIPVLLWTVHVHLSKIHAQKVIQRKAAPSNLFPFWHWFLSCLDFDSFWIRSGMVLPVSSAFQSGASNSPMGPDSGIDLLHGHDNHQYLSNRICLQYLGHRIFKQVQGRLHSRTRTATFSISKVRCFDWF